MPAGGLATQGIASMAGNVGAGLTGLVSGITGFFQKKKGNKLLEQNPFPTEAMPSEVLANQQIAQGAATEGMPSEQYAAAKKDIERNQAAAAAAASTSPGSLVRNIGAIQEGSNTATGKLNAESAEMRRQNIGQLLAVNNQVASWRDKLFDWNQRAKYEQNRQYAMSLIGAGNANMMAGLDKVIGAGVGGAASGAFGGGSKAGAAPAAYEYSPELANTGGGYSDPSALLVGGRMNTLAPNYLNN